MVGSPASTSVRAPALRMDRRSTGSPAASRRPSAGPTSSFPRVTAESLREVAVRARFRERVLGDWAMRPGGGRGHGVVALFAGDSGTGKTMSAEVIGARAGPRPVRHRPVDASSTSTSARPRRTWSACSRPRPARNGVLLFDEADAVFGKRSEVRDAHDRYANVESAYLLQRMERFDGLAMLSTNLRANIDEAFTRRLDAHHRLPHAGCRAPRASCGTGVSGTPSSAPPISTSSSSARRSNSSGGSHPIGRRDGRLLRRGRRTASCTMRAARGRRRAGISQAGPAAGGERVRSLLAKGGRMKTRHSGCVGRQPARRGRQCGPFVRMRMARRRHAARDSQGARTGRAPCPHSISRLPRAQSIAHVRTGASQTAGTSGLREHRLDVLGPAGDTPAAA